MRRTLTMALATATAVSAIALAAGCGGKAGNGKSAGGGEGARTSAKTYSYDHAGEYVRDLLARLDKINQRLNEIDPKIQATAAPQTPEMEARLDVLRSISEDIHARAIDAENTATEKDWPVWQQSLEGSMANLVRSTARLDSMVTAVRQSP